MIDSGTDAPHLPTGIPPLACDVMRITFMREIGPSGSILSRPLPEHDATMVGRPAGVVLCGVLTGFVGADFGDGVYTLFLDFIGRDFEKKENEVRNFRSETERQIAVMREVRARVLQDFTRTVQRLEETYPQSLLGGVQWQAQP